jgi:hypothetical protein
MSRLWEEWIDGEPPLIEPMRRRFMAKEERRKRRQYAAPKKSDPNADHDAATRRMFDEMEPSAF